MVSIVFGAGGSRSFAPQPARAAHLELNSGDAAPLPTDPPPPENEDEGQSAPVNQERVQRAALVASAACSGNNLQVTISAGDGPFNITYTEGPGGGLFGVGLGTHTLTGPATWKGLAVTEQGGDQETIQLGDKTCPSQQDDELVASAQCMGNDLWVTISEGDEPFNITGNGPNLPLNGVGIDTHIISGPGQWTGLTVSEQGGDQQSLALGNISCGAPPVGDLQATVECSGNNLAVTILQGDGPFTLTGNGPGLPVGPFLSAAFVNGPGQWTNLVVHELGGDQQSLNLNDTSCPPAQNVDLEVTAQCNGNNLEVAIAAGDGPFDVTGTGPGLPLNGVGTGLHVLTGPGAWTGVAVTEQGGDGQTANLGAFSCQPPPPICTDPNPRRDLKIVGWIHDEGSFAWAIVRNRSQNCEYHVNMAAYKVFDGSVATQELFSFFTGDPGALILPGQDLQLQVPLPECQAQVDVFYGHIIFDFSTGERYSWPENRLLDSLHTNRPWCAVTQPLSVPGVPSALELEQQKANGLDSTQ